MASWALALYFTRPRALRPRDSGNKYANAKLAIQ